ncbi:MAG: DUF1549 domain-containing protein [Planctomycetaceae bacterium]
MRIPKDVRLVCQWSLPLCCIVIGLLSGQVGLVASAQEQAPAKSTAVVTKLEVYPDQIQLADSRSEAQFVVIGKTAAGETVDLTSEATFTADPPANLLIKGGFVLPSGNGAGKVAVSVRGLTAEVPYSVAGHGVDRPVWFRREMLSALTRQGCNMGACHGSPSGKGGFRLSLRAFDPELDKLTLIREDLGRRTNLLQPEKSLLLAKPLMQVAHGGGQKILKTDYTYSIMVDWISAGCPVPEEAQEASCVKLEVSPPSGQVMRRPDWTQQVAVIAHFSDGTKRDVSRLASLSSSDEEVAVISPEGKVIGKGRGEAAIIARYMDQVQTCELTFIEDVPNYVWNSPSPANYVDQLVYTKLQKLSYLPSPICSDEEFVRRVYLDVIGVLPAPAEAEAFIADKATDKRLKLINQLLERPEFAKFWALKWGDLLRLTSAQIGPEALFKYNRWLEESFAQNVPYDQFVAQLITATGSTLENPAANFYRTATETNDCVETVSQVFMGSRLQCAKCHNHPFERWTQDNYFGMAAFFNRVQRKKMPRADEFLVYMNRSGEVTQPRTGKITPPWLPNVGPAPDAEGKDRRLEFAKWLTQTDNAFFARVEVNRIWGQLLGRGIVEPVDDFRDSNPPSNRELLDALAKDFREKGFDRKAMMRTILSSNTYQADYRGTPFNQSDIKYFSHAQPRLLGAEQLLDAVGAVTGLPEKFAGLPEGTKATQVPAPDLVKHEFLRIFGQPERTTVCQCERGSESNLAMAIQFFNGPLIYSKLRDPQNRFRQGLAAGKTPDVLVKELYMAAVCRVPTDAELATAQKHLASKPDIAAGLEDLCWALLNSNEFLFQH